MAHPLLVRDEAKKRLGQAVQAVETRSCAEIVIAVQPRSDRWLGVDGGVGLAVAYLALLYTLFAPHVFGLGWIALIVPASFAVGFAMSRALTGLRMWLAGSERVRAAVLTGARARFTELRISATRERSGVLVYVSLAERCVAVVPDVGVIARVPEKEWAAAAARIEDTIASHGVGEPGLAALCSAVEALGPVLEPTMPRRHDDTNELEDVA
ncbi:MAG: hypothetical protein K0V04_19300 [Deltaproteobacteria bacterium]|nr:hypothetical protein [Deltaproteobacteria bacterium]